jgi:lysophospholipase L1-like esterase
MLFHVTHGMLPPDSLNPKLWWIHIGTNDILPNCGGCDYTFNTTAAIVEIAHQVLKRKPESHIVLHGILPRGEGMGQHELRAAFKQIKEINTRLRRIASLHPRLHYFDSSDLFVKVRNSLGGVNQVDKNGVEEDLLVMDTTKYRRDCTHPSLLGYELMGDRIESEIKFLLEDSNPLRLKSKLLAS